MARRVLVVSSRFPWPVVTGDRIRALAWLQALALRAGVTLVAPPGVVPSGAPPFRFVAARRSLTALAVAAARAVAEGFPATALLAAGYDWRGALARAQDGAGAFDAAVVLLARLDPWVVRDIRAERMVFDAVDSLAANLEARAAASRGPARWLWRWEAARTRLLESDAARRYDRTLVVAEAERAAFGERAAAIFHGVELDPPATGDRDFDVGFWGRLAYFANRDAARLVREEIWPRIRAHRPEATLLVAGADAPAAVRGWHGRDGITVVSPMEDRAALLRRVKVALFPLRFGTGQSNKVLEAAEASCALVATPEAVRGLDAIAAGTALATKPEELAARVIELLDNPTAARAAGSALRAAVEREYSRAAACERLAAAALGEPDPG
ncbi:MAG TPA: glycosyltransferase family 4 protein [Thermoanaerobaculaceae bacterium]|nr:glycosyltransferase family 4 protein [Thermoanaerobaculaceae bacterium]